MCHFIHLCHWHPVPHPHLQHQMGKLEGGTVTPIKSDPEASEASTPLASLRPMDPIPTPSLPMLTPYPPSSQEHLASLCEDPPSPQASTTLQMSLREVQDPVYYDQDSQIQGGQIFVYQPFTTTHLPNWKHHTPSFTEKPQALIDLMQSIIQTHKSTWTNHLQLLLTLFNIEEQCHITLASLKWLKDNAPEGICSNSFPQGRPALGPQ
jgi:hypothetical protein